MLLFFTGIAKYFYLFLDKFYLFSCQMTKIIANRCTSLKNRMENGFLQVPNKRFVGRIMSWGALSGAGER